VIAPTRRGHGEYSKFVVEAIRSIHCPGRLALDIPSGEGRHSRFLASQGFQVVSADLDMKALLRGASASRGPNMATITSVRLDATKSLPFPSGTFDLALVVHFELDSILPQIESVIKRGGFLVLETFGSHGQNWRNLPLATELQRRLDGKFHLLQYVERATRKDPDRVTVRAVGRKE
jgi:SAM-dependent methyltransferase